MPRLSATSELLPDADFAALAEHAEAADRRPDWPQASWDILRRAGLLESRKEERYIYYSVQRERVTALVRLLTACC